jgi:pre-rRNA-processing protein IPI1
MLAPHVPVLLLFSASALSHIFPEIRVDAVRFIDILLDIVPDTVVGNWANSDMSPLANQGGEASASGTSSSGRWILEGYLALLDVSSSSGGTILCIDSSAPV